ncbi:MAG TPA: phosphate ABC transporter substrate-binding protein [Gallionella sp.]|nr:phosphate ABC transporter substrate-binding protein [Gallionella sp.]
MGKKGMQHVFVRGALCAASILFVGSAQAEPVVVVAGAKSPAGSLSKDQASDIFMGKATNLTPVDQPESSPLRDEFYSKVTGKSAAQARAYWSKLAFTGKGTPPKECQSSADIKKQLADNPNLLGYIEKSAVDGSVKVLYSAQ